MRLFGYARCLIAALRSIHFFQYQHIFRDISVCCCAMQTYGRGHGCLRGQSTMLPHDEIRDGPCNVSKRNSSIDDCRGHNAVVPCLTSRWT